MPLGCAFMVGYFLYFGGYPGVYPSMDETTRVTVAVVPGYTREWYAVLLGQIVAIL